MIRLRKRLRVTFKAGKAAPFYKGFSKTQR